MTFYFSSFTRKVREHLSAQQAGDSDVVIYNSIQYKRNCISINASWASLVREKDEMSKKED